jgi:hypothetical protein
LGVVGFGIALAGGEECCSDCQKKEGVFHFGAFILMKQMSDEYLTVVPTTKL